MLASTLLLSLLATIGHASPFRPGSGSGSFVDSTGCASGCDISSAVMALPANQTALPAPNVTLSFLGLGIGTQNYTCSSAGTYTSTGALAQLFDISCLYGQSAFDSINDQAISAWQSSTSTDPLTFVSSSSLAIKGAKVLGEHYFIDDAAGLVPKWDFTSQSEKGNANAFVVGTKVGTLAAPTSANDVPWLYLTAASGDLASEVYRMETRSGQPPASCTPGTPDITVKYDATYWLFGGSIA